MGRERMATSQGTAVAHMQQITNGGWKVASPGTRATTWNGRSVANGGLLRQALSQLGHMDVMTLQHLWTNQPVIIDLMCLLDHLVFRLFWSLHFVHVDTDLRVLDHLAEVSHTNK